MNGETTIAQGLRATDDSAGYDAACKRILSEKIILAWSLMETLGLTIEQAMAALKIPEDEKQKYTDLLNQH